MACIEDEPCAGDATSTIDGRIDFNIVIGLDDDLSTLPRKQLGAKCSSNRLGDNKVEWIKEPSARDTGWGSQID
jgi:hypothetical protein